MTSHSPLDVFCGRNLVCLFVVFSILVAGYLPCVMAQTVPLVVYGYIHNPDGSAASGASVTASAAGTSGHATAGSDGKYQITLSVPPGSQSVSVSASLGSLSGSGSGSGEGSVRVDITLHAAAPPPPPPSPTSSVSISLTKTVIALGESITITGTVKPPRAITVTIEMSTDQATWSNLIQVTSTQSGVYSYVWTPPGVDVIYYLRARIPASGSLPAATSGVVTLQVTMMPGATVKLSNATTLPSGDICHVYACSSSSSLMMSVDADKKKISITVSGPSGTTGTTMIFLPDELMDAYGMTAGDLLFTVDGIEVTPTILGVPGGYIVTLIYSHSSHAIAVYYSTYQIAVTVLDHAGSPVAAGTIVNLTGPVTRSASTNASGIALFTKLVAGSYVISALEPGTAGNVSLTVASSGRLVLRTTIGGLQAQYDALQTEHQQLQTTYQRLQGEHQTLQIDYESLQASYEDLQSENQRLQGDYDNLRNLALGYGAAATALVILLAVLLYRARKAQPRKPATQENRKTGGQEMNDTVVYAGE